MVGVGYEKRWPTRAIPMTHLRLTCWLVTGLVAWLCFALPFGSTAWIAAALLLLVASRLALGNLLIFFLVTGWVALSGADLTSDSLLQGLYLPLWVMLSAIYLLGFAVFIVPELAHKGSAPGSSGLGGGNGGGDGGC